MNGFNKVIIVGTLGADPKNQVAKNGKAFTSLSLATNRRWKNEEGEETEKTDWHKITVFGKQGELCQKYLKKGSNVCVEGYLTSFTYDIDGKKHKYTSITAEGVNFLPSRASMEL